MSKPIRFFFALFNRIRRLGNLLRWLPVYLRFCLKGSKRCFNIFTHLTKIERLLLYNLGLQIPHKGVIVEIGSYLGGSSTFLSLAARSKGGMLYCIDTWKNEGMTEGKRDTFEEFCKNIESVKDYITPLRGYSTDIAKTFEKKIDLLFIDGGHSYEDVKDDVEAWFPKVKDGGIVVFHDIGWAEGVIRVVNEFVKPIQIEAKGHIVDNTYWARIKKK